MNMMQILDFYAMWFPLDLSLIQLRSGKTQIEIFDNAILFVHLEIAFYAHISNRSGVCIIYICDLLRCCCYFVCLRVAKVWGIHPMPAMPKTDF